MMKYKMISPFFLYTIIWLIVASASAADFLSDFSLPAKNYVRNGSFKNGLEGWHFFKKEGGEIVPEGHDGGPCFKITGGHDDHIYLYNKATDRGWGIDLKADRTYTLSAWFKSENVKDLFSDKALLIVNYGWTASLGLGPDRSSGWVKKSITFSPPQQTRQFDETALPYSMLVFWPRAANGTLWIDDIQIEEGPEATAFTDFWNFRALEIRDALNVEYAKTMRATNALRTNFPQALDLSDQLQGHLQTIEQLGARLASSEQLNNETCKDIEEKIQKAAGQSADVMFPVWLKNPFLISQPTDFPSALSPPKTQKFSCYINMTRNLALMLTNFSGKNMDVRVAPQSFINTQNQQKISGNSFITVYDTPLMRGHFDKDALFSDALPRANAINSFTVTSGITKQVVLSFSTENLLPGRYHGSVLVDALHEHDFTREIQVELEVLPVKLPDRVPVDVGAFGAGFLRKEEVRRLGHNVLMIDLSSFFPRFYAAPNNYMTVDYQRLDIAIEEALSSCSDCKFMFIFSIGPRFIKAANRHGINWPDARLKEAWQAWIKDIYQHLQTQKVDAHHFYLQVVDEPGPEEALTAIELQKLAKLAVPELQITTTLTGFHPEQPNYNDFYNSVDYVIPIVRSIRNPECVEFFNSRGAKVAIYDCAESSESLHPIGYYRLMPWRVWQNNLAGWYYWYRCDRKPNWNSVKYQSIVYPDRDGSAQFTNNPIWPEDKYTISRRWLAMEAGYQDYKMLYQLKNTLNVIKDELNADADLVRNAQSFLNHVPTEVLKLDDPAQYPRDIAKEGKPEIIDEMNEKILGFTNELLAYDTFHVVEKPAINKNGVLTFKTSESATVTIKYLLDGKLPWRAIEVTSPNSGHQILIPKAHEERVSKCIISAVDKLGKVLTISPFPSLTVSTDSVFPGGYDLECLIDGERVPGAQYWMGKTWISKSDPGEHWVQLDLETPAEISQINISWMSRGGLPTAYKLQYQMPGNEQWFDLAGDWRTAQSAFERIYFQPLLAKAVRVIQKALGGNPSAPAMMGISEVEVF